MTTFHTRNRKIKRCSKLGEYSNTKNTEAIIEKVDNIVRDINAEKIPIIVEGVNDKKTLRNLGIETRIFTTQNRYKQNLVEFVETIEKTINGKKILILTDFDKEGETLNKKLTSELTMRGFTPLHGVRRAIRKLLFKHSKQIESITV
ncbi:MAG: toprim domain-containing protein [Candidatus Odinarchaeota archaeon]|nr:toprim domain-containing protein [Candidatus Odinarchaeota archaeon]